MNKEKDNCVVVPLRKIAFLFNKVYVAFTCTSQIKLRNQSQYEILITKEESAKNLITQK